MEIKRYLKNDTLEYHCMDDNIMRGILFMSAQNYRQVDPSCGWGLVPKVVGIRGSVEANQFLMDFLFRHAQSPILAEVSKEEAETLVQFGFVPLLPSLLVWDVEKELN